MHVKIGKSHAKYFDKDGWLYFTKVSLELQYPSNWDNDPNFMGGMVMSYVHVILVGLGIDTNEVYEL